MNNKSHLRPKDFDSNGDIIPMACKEEKRDLISREALNKTIDGITWYHINPHGELTEGAFDDDDAFYKAEDIYNAIDNAPTVDTYTIEDIQEVRENALILGAKLAQRPQGEWIDHSEDGYVECPFCEHLTNCEDNIDELHYCWNCGANMMKGGADMRGGKE